MSLTLNLCDTLRLHNIFVLDYSACRDDCDRYAVG
jgi:hypothetical protein